ncbi:helix-turn-helix domain-containing protein [Micromonospora endophytica]|uniref:DNA-binding protein n=1 Tax=Micromonospora endophytica TaxID=515350 RepID=A0A2W2BQ08_9ACTN|nr:XRE family transcriptional regulator [Micromonospora endophytica]PZF87470.1 DNA-binding protein [Micromonospora endophytica]RIW48586.1 XRE family transcriptional regulator [Micromonospora endophytica]BCJ61062.1 XRE family transcriptional regulator [Micromonospora endophytica]
MSSDPSPPLATIAAALRYERQRVGLSITELARRAGIAKSTLSQLESGVGNPSVETLWALGVALDVPFSRLVERPAHSVRVIRAGDGPRIRSEHADFTGTLLSAGTTHARRDVYLIELEPDGIRTAEPHTPRSVEHVVVGAGRLRCGPEHEPVELGPGDYATFPGDAPHHYQALEPGTFAVLIMEHP